MFLLVFKAIQTNLRSCDQFILRNKESNGGRLFSLVRLKAGVPVWSRTVA